MAIQHYLDNNRNSDDGENYLTVYGVLQTLFLQQDAVEHLSEALDLKYQINHQSFKISETYATTALGIQQIEKINFLQHF